MSYLIAVATSDGKNIDLTFGATDSFHVYEVEGTAFTLKEVRRAVIQDQQASDPEGSCNKECPDIPAINAGGCGNGQGCGEGGGGCGGGGHSAKVDIISDCRSIVCKKIGFQAQKQLEKKAIASFDVECTVEEALTKISTYFSKIDNHISLRREVN
jgi:predicted Fe-Mo cluster-binding NifX family protein